jgi:hypothetical protein
MAFWAQGVFFVALLAAFVLGMLTHGGAKDRFLPGAGSLASQAAPANPADSAMPQSPYRSGTPFRSGASARGVLKELPVQ